MPTPTNKSGLRDNHTRGTVADFMRRILCSAKDQPCAELCHLFDQETNHGSDMRAYDTLLQRAVDSLASTFRKRAASGLISSRDFILPNAHEQVHEKTDLELVTWLVIKEDKA